MIIGYKKVYLDLLFGNLASLLSCSSNSFYFADSINSNVAYIYGDGGDKLAKSGELLTYILTN